MTIENSTIPNDLFIGLREQTPSAVIDWGDGCCLRCVVVKETPVAIVPVKVSEEGIHDKYIPEVFQ